MLSNLNEFYWKTIHSLLYFWHVTLSPFTYHKAWHPPQYTGLKKIITYFYLSVTCRAGSAYHFWSTWYSTSGFWWGSCCSVVSFLWRGSVLLFVFRVCLSCFFFCVFFLCFLLCYGVIRLFPIYEFECPFVSFASLLIIFYPKSLLKHIFPTAAQSQINI